MVNLPGSNVLEKNRAPPYFDVPGVVGARAEQPSYAKTIYLMRYIYINYCPSNIYISYNLIILYHSTL